MVNNLRKIIKKNRNVLIFLAIFVLASILRLDHLSLRPLWLDEAGVANALNTNLINSWSNLVNSGSNVAYFYLLKFWSVLFGNNEIGLRSLSVILSLLSLIAIYKLGVLIRGVRTGLWAAFLLAINYFSIFYSIQARQYSLVILLSILSYFQFYILLKHFRYKNVIWYLFFTVLGVCSHPWFLLLLGSQFISWLLYKKSFKILFCQIAAVFISSPWIVILWQYRENGASSWISLTSFKTIFDTFHYFMYGATGIYIIFGLISALAIFGYLEETKDRIYFKLKKINYNKIISNLSWLLGYLFIPLLVAWIVGHFVNFYEPGRYEAVVLPAFILLFAILFSRLKNKWIVCSLILLLIIFSYAEVIREKNNIKNQKINERTVVSNFLSIAQDNDWLVFTGLSRPTIDYYIGRMNINLKFFIKKSFPEEMATHQLYQDVNKIIKNNNNTFPSSDVLINNIKSSGSKRVWLVFTEDNPFAATLKNDFRKNFTEKGHLEGTSYMIFLYEL